MLVKFGSYFGELKVGKDGDGSWGWFSLPHGQKYLVDGIWEDVGKMGYRKNVYFIRVR